MEKMETMIEATVMDELIDVEEVDTQDIPEDMEGVTHIICDADDRKATVAALREAAGNFPLGYACLYLMNLYHESDHQGEHIRAELKMAEGGLEVAKEKRHIMNMKGRIANAKYDLKHKEKTQNMIDDVVNPIFEAIATHGNKALLKDTIADSSILGKIADLLAHVLDMWGVYEDECVRIG